MNKPDFSEEDSQTRKYEVQFSQSSCGSNQSIHMNYATPRQVAAFAAYPSNALLPDESSARHVLLFRTRAY